MKELISRLIPLFLILFLGAAAGRKRLLGEEFIGQLKKLVVNLFLPATLFQAFLRARLSVRYLYLFGGVFLFCLVLYLAGRVFRKTGLLPRNYSPEFLTGFEFGMVGIALFSGIFGAGALPVMALVGLGHEFFIWFVYVPLLQSREEGGFSLLRTLRSFLRSPIILGILSALILNLAGLVPALDRNFLSAGVLQGIGWLASATGAVILIIVGYGLRPEKGEIGQVLKYSLTRLTAVLALGVPVYLLIRSLVPELPDLFFYAWATFLLLPPPFIIPIYIRQDLQEENRFFTGCIVFYTLVSLGLYVLFLFFFPPVL